MVDAGSLRTLDRIFENLDYYQSMAGSGQLIVDVEYAGGQGVSFHLAVVEMESNGDFRLAGDSLEHGNSMEVIAVDYEGPIMFNTVHLVWPDGETVGVEHLEVNNVD